MRIRFILRAIGVLVLSFVLASAAMYWLPFFMRSSGPGIIPDYVSTYLPAYESTYIPSYYSDYSTALDYSTAILRNLAPIEERPLLEVISSELQRKTDSELYKLKAFEDICANDLVNCRGLPSAKIKPFIDAELSARHAAETASLARLANFIAEGSLFISCLALIFTALTYLSTRKVPFPRAWRPRRTLKSFES
jgi:hypothetical protein